MGLFILAASVLVLVALAFVVYPLWKAQRNLALALLVCLPLLTFGLYKYVGTPQALDPAFIARNQPAPDISTAIAGLREELNAHPDNLEGWTLLARTQMQMQDFASANQAYEKAILLDPKNPDLKTERAEAMMRGSDKRAFPPEAIELLTQTLAENPEHERALFFMGMNYMQQKDPARAETYLSKLLPKMSGDAANAIREQINIARADQNKPPLPSDEKAVSGATLNITVSMDDSLASALKPGAVLFVFAKPVNGAGPPVAAKKLETGNFPMQLALSDADSLMPTANLSSQQKVSLSARLSMQGDAIAHPGDIEADAVVVETTSKSTVEIKLSRVIQ